MVTVMSRLRVLALTTSLFMGIAVPQATRAQQQPDAAAPAADAPVQQPSSQGPSSGISCMMRDGAPTTVSQTRRGEVPIIRWTSSDFDASGWTAEKRCQVVSQRFEVFRSNGQLQYLTTGRVAGQPVICAVRAQNAPCTGADVLYTLKPGQDAGATLVRLLAVRRGVSGPISETTRRMYISFDRLIEDKLAAKGGAAPVGSTRPASGARPVQSTDAAPF